MDTGGIEGFETRKTSSQRSDSAEVDDNDEKLRMHFLKKSSSGLRRLRKPSRSLAAFSELSMSRSSIRFDEKDDDRVRVEYYVNENTIKERLHIFFFKNQRSSLRIRILRFCLKLLTCILYIIRVIMDDDPTFTTCHGCPISDKSSYLAALNLTDEEFLEHPVINWEAIVWVHRPVELWIIHIILAFISFTETILLLYLNYKGNIFQQILTRRFALELVTTIPFIGTLLYPPLINLFVPVFLNAWLAKYALEHTFNDLHRAMQRSQSALSQQLFILSVTLLCLVFTSVCGVQHFQRAGHRRMSLFQAFYFVVVTFSTVGYGDYVPDIWPSQLFMVAMICIALIVLPTQFEQLAFTWMERQKLGGSYSSHRAHNEHHVVVCSTTLHADTIMDFLNEFYAHPLLQDFYVVLLSPMELDPTMRMILQVPIWAQRVIYIQGSCLKDADLIRARMGEAEACFILAARNYADKTAADEHTILRSWAVKDYAPSVPQYLQIFRPENKLHVRFAEHVVCEDEFKYALLSNNCLFPGTSTLVTLLLHTSRGREGETSKEEWQRLYGKCSGNEIYHIRLGDSKFFGEYEGKSFTYASFHSHRKYGVCLVGVRPAKLPEFYEDTILLNPGPRHIMKKSDICFYLSITKEEHSAFITNNNVPIASSEVNDDGDESDNAQIHTTMPNPQQKSETLRPNSINNTAVSISCDQDQDDDDNQQQDDSDFGGGKIIQTTHATISIAVDQIIDERKMSVIGIQNPNMNLLMLPTNSMDQRTNARRPSILPVPESLSESGVGSHDTDAPSDGGGGTSDEADDEVPWMGIDVNEMPQVIKGFPPVSPYIGVTPTLCYLLRDKKPLCCLQLAQACEHSANRTAFDYHWKNRTIILAADVQSNAIYNFIVPLRAHFRPKGKLNPIILLLERRPSTSFLDAISHFPMIYWMLGSIDNMDDLLRAGITIAESVVVVNKELSNSAEEDTLSDCNTIVAVQTMFRFFPHVKIVTELSQSNNMRFMQFRADDSYALQLSRMEKREKERGSHISYMFRLPFACGSVFSASMLDTLLYQAFVKDYLITFVRLLLGIDQAPGSGFLTSMEITKEDLWIRTYGRLYQKLCSTTCEIPIGIYRTQESHQQDMDYYDQTNPNRDMIPIKRRESAEASGVSSPSKGMRISRTCFEVCGSESASLTSGAYLAECSAAEELELRDTHTQLIERAEMNSLIRSRMESNGLPYGTECDQETSEKRISHSYVIINPSSDLKICNGDVIYLIRPSPFSAQKTFERHNSRRKSTLHMSGSAAAASQSASAAGVGGNPVSNNANFDDFNINNSFLRHNSRRSSGESFKGHFSGIINNNNGPYGGGSCGATPIFKHTRMAKSNSMSLPDSPRQRSNSLRISNPDDILIRRTNSLRQGLGFGLGRRKHSHGQGSVEEIGLPIPNQSHRGSLHRETRLSLTGGVRIKNFEHTPPEIRIACNTRNNSGESDEDGQQRESTIQQQGTIV